MLLEEGGHIGRDAVAGGEDGLELFAEEGDGVGVAEEDVGLEAETHCYEELSEEGEGHGYYDINYIRVFKFKISLYLLKIHFLKQY